MAADEPTSQARTPIALINGVYATLDELIEMLGEVPEPEPD